MQQRLNKLLAAAERYRLQPFDSEYFSANALGSSLLFLHFDAAEQTLLLYSPLLRLREADLTVPLLQRLLQLNQPAEPTMSRVGLADNGQVWISRRLTLAQTESCDLDALLDSFLAEAAAALAAVAESAAEAGAEAADNREEPEPAAVQPVSFNNVFWG